MSLDAFIQQLEEEIQDPEEETFLLFSRPIPSHNLGFIDPQSRTVDVPVAGKDLTIHQSPGVLSSSRAGGTTGAVLWKITPLLASYLSSPSQNPLLSSHILTPSSTVLELGCGISPLAALALAPHISHYTLTDQPYVQKLVSLNLAENKPRRGSGDVVFRSLDWEADQVSRELSPSGNFDLVLACDCVYNYALVKPLVQTCADACRLREREDGIDGEKRPSVCVVAQQLRSDDVLQEWLAEFHKHFRVWRFPDHLLPEGLRPDDGFVIHAGILRS